MHDAGKNIYSPDAKTPDPNTWPEEWLTVYYKEYDRFQSVKLPSEEPASEFPELVASRRSHRDFSGAGLSLSELGYLLKYSAGEFLHHDGRTHRAYASGGNRYPIELYVILKTDTDQNLTPGVYHYNIKKHALEYLWKEKESGANPELLTRDPWTHKASALIVMTSVFWRTHNKYQDKGYRLVCMDVGAIIQNIYLSAGAIDLKAVAYAGTFDDKIEDLLRLDTDQESLLCSILVGK